MSAINIYIGGSNPGQLTDTAITSGSSSTSTLNVELRIQTQDNASTKTNITVQQVFLILENIKRYIKKGGLTNFTNAVSGSEVLPAPGPAGGKTYTN